MGLGAQIPLKLISPPATIAIPTAVGCSERPTFPSCPVNAGTPQFVQSAHERESHRGAHLRSPGSVRRAEIPTERSEPESCESIRRYLKAKLASTCGGCVLWPMRACSLSRRRWGRTGAAACVESADGDCVLLDARPTDSQVGWGAQREMVVVSGGDHVCHWVSLTAFGFGP